jgi:hypothetical protein
MHLVQALGLALAHLHSVFGPYVFIPIITTLAWLSGLLALMAIWVRDGKPNYAPKEADVVFISNVAGKHKVRGVPRRAKGEVEVEVEVEVYTDSQNVFIPMTCVTAG